MTGYAYPNFHSAQLSPGMPLGMAAQQVTLTADNTVIDMAGYSLLQLGSDSATATSRTFTLANSTLPGQQIVIEFVSGSSYSAELATGTNMKLASTWKPLQYDTLSLMWDNTLAAWIELDRKTQAANVPAYVVVYAGNYTTAGGSATEAQTLTGVASTDIVLAVLKVAGATPRTLLTTAPTTNTITYTFSGNPSTDHVVAYQVLRAYS